MAKFKHNLWQNLTLFLLFMTSIFGENKALAAPIVPFNLAPEGARQANRYNNVQPSDFSSLSPWGEAINTNASDGYIDIKSFKMACNINGQMKQVFNSNFANLNAGSYLTEPSWYYQDINTPLTIQKKDWGIRIPVQQGKITHWWLKQRPTITNAKDCKVTATVRLSQGVFVSIGADWWRNPTIGWGGQDVNNIYMGRSDWYNNQTGWQVIQF